MLKKMHRWRVSIGDTSCVMSNTISITHPESNQETDIPETFSLCIKPLDIIDRSLTPDHRQPPIPAFLVTPETQYS